MPLTLPRAGYGSDVAVLHVLWPQGGYIGSDGRPTVCFEYGAEEPSRSRREQARSLRPRLCVRLRRTSAAVRLARHMPSEVGAVDIRNALNDAGITPHELPTSLDVEGMELHDSEWTVP